MLNLAKFFQDRAKDHKQPRDWGDAESSRAKTARSSGENVVPAGSSSREAISSFVRAYLPAIAVVKRSGKASVDGLALTFDVLTQTLLSIDASSPADASTNSDRSDIMSEMDANAFVLAEELLLTMEATDVQLHPPPAFVSALTHIACQPQRMFAWQSVVRLLTYLSMEKTPSCAPVVIASARDAEPPEAQNKQAVVTTKLAAASPSTSTPKRQAERDMTPN